MAGITQTIPQYSLGMSEQPDQLKFPGQVQEVVNAIPDITRGLFKRPGAKRIGSDKLTNVQSGGSWFHYFRDEIEGSYIGQVAADGQVRVWRCKDGQEMTTSYTHDGVNHQTAVLNYLKTNISATYGRSGTTITVTSTNHNMQTNDVITADFTGGATDGTYPITKTGANTFTITDSASGTISTGTALTYLKKGSHENLQFLTINDTTFVSSRDTDNANTIVGMTGTTDATPDAHFGFIELLRSENGRQYGVNVHGANTTVTTVTRATRIKIQSDTLDESDGTGHCPGIGTQVFSVDQGSKKNLIFRINTLGQQGVSPNYSASSDGPDGQNYRCSYNREAVLLHGGEGWVTGDTTTVTLDSASGGGSGGATHATYTIRVEDHESTEVNATVSSAGDGLIRPEPTPFDADTAVTTDTIIGGIIADLPSGISGKQIGTGIYLSSANQFSLEIVEDDLMRCFQSSVNDVQNLPNQ